MNVDFFSRGFSDDISSGDLSRLVVDGIDYSLGMRGHNIAAFTMSGSPINQAAFDTHGIQSSGTELTAFIDDLPSNTLVLVAVYDNGHNYYHSAVDALITLGAVTPYGPVNHRGSLFLIGYKDHPRPSWVTQGYAQIGEGPSKGAARFLRKGCFPHGSQAEKWCNP
ncbi:uncharacterized protein LOC116619478 [Nematostella vectensis]|uniref:uncharacterized protein LOC116619478 n=1 Tax=Nematostella vectensis TaxID=45351 RepID=UPI00207771DC|nr:uncharacterized protein LOC116619478 [Nematostella vectensis]